MIQGQSIDQCSSTRPNTRKCLSNRKAEEDATIGPISAAWLSETQYLHTHVVWGTMDTPVLLQLYLDPFPTGHDDGLRFALLRKRHQAK
jgi:hypothetical protein